jgi:AcrR family transcriptional regulator
MAASGGNTDVHCQDTGGAVTTAPAPGTVRRRGDVLRQAIFAAVFEQLQTVGYHNLTMDGVAATARTGKAALYRRWAGRDELVRDALRETLPSPRDVELTGGLRADVLALLRCIQDAFLSTHGTAFQIVSAEAGCQRGLVRDMVTEQVVAPCADLILEVLRAAAARGEVRPGAVTPTIARVGPAMLVHQAITERAPVSEAYLDAVVDAIILPLVQAQD